MSPNHKAYMAIIIHFDHIGQLMAMLLDLIEVPRSHSGVDLAEAFLNVLQAFGVEDKVDVCESIREKIHLLSITDNTSNNDTMLDCLSSHLGGSKPNPLLCAHCQYCGQSNHSTIRHTKIEEWQGG